MSQPSLPSLPSILSRSSKLENDENAIPTAVKRSTQFDEIVDPWNNNLRHDNFRSSGSMSSLHDDAHTESRTVLGLRPLVFWILVSLITIMLVVALSIGLALGIPAASKHHEQPTYDPQTLTADMLISNTPRSVTATALSGESASESRRSLHTPAASTDSDSKSVSSEATLTTSWQTMMSLSLSSSSTSARTPSYTTILSSDVKCPACDQKWYRPASTGLSDKAAPRFQIHCNESFPNDSDDYDQSGIAILDTINASNLAECIDRCLKYNEDPYSKYYEGECTNVAQEITGKRCWLKRGDTSNITPTPRANSVYVDSAVLVLGG